MLNLNSNFTRVFTTFAILIAIVSVYVTLQNKAEAAPGINRQINFQGKLVANPAGTNVSDTSYTVVFTIYDRATGGTALWTETQSVTTADGIFRVALGSVTAFPTNFNFNWNGLYLGIKVNADSEMTPRVQLAAVPYAFNAERVAGLTVQDTSGNASTSGILQVGNATTVNLGTNNLTFTTSGTTTLTLPTTGTLATLAGVEILTNKTIGSTGLTFSGASTDITTGTNEDFIVLPNGTGKIAFNVASPLASFDVRANSVNGGTLAVASVSGTTSFAALVSNNDGLGDLFTASSSGVSKFTVKRTGELLLPAYNAVGCTLKTDTNGLVTCGTDNTGGGGYSPFQELSKAIAPNNSTLDFLVGGQSSTSATFALLNNSLARGSQIASISGSVTLDSTSASVQSVKNQLLTIGGNTTGEIQFKPGNSSTSLYLSSNGNVGVGTLAPSSKLQVVKADSSGSSTSNVLSLTHSSNGSTGFTPDTGSSLETSLYSYWNMDESSGTLATDSINAQNGTATGTTIVAGKLGNARTYASGDKVQTTYVQSGLSSFSASAWVKTTSGSDMQILSDRGGSIGITLGIGTFGGGGTAGNPYIGADGSGVFIGVYSSVGIHDGNWHHIVGTWSGGGSVTAGQFNIYVDGSNANGATQTAGSTSTPVTGDSAGSIIGSNSFTDFIGTIDEVGVWTKSLSSQEVTDLYNSGNANTYQSASIASGIGAGLLFENQNSIGEITSASRITGVLTNPTNGLESGALVFETISNASVLVERVRIDDSGNLLVGTNSATAKLDIAGTASLGGVLKFRSGTAQVQSTANQTLTLGGDTTGHLVLKGFNGAVNGITFSGYNTCTLKTDSTGLVTCGTDNTGAGGGGSSPFQELLGAIVPLNSTEDFLIGGQSTPSALFSFTGIATGQTIASVSGNFIVMPNNGWGGNVGIGVTNPTARLEVSSPPSITGSELVTNGTFTGSATGWTLGGDTAYGSNNVVSTYAGGNTAISTTFSTTAAKTYLLTFDISAANVRMFFYLDNNNYYYDTGPLSNGTHTVAFTTDFTGTETINFDVWNDNTTIGGTWTIDNVSIKEARINNALAVKGYDGTTWLSLGGDLVGNTGLGKDVLSSNTTGAFNTAFGIHALSSNTTGAFNNAFGAHALTANTIGEDNNAFGKGALSLNTEGNENNAFGNGALSSNTTGSSNSAFGSAALMLNTTGSNNSVFGAWAGASNTTGSSNTFIGDTAGSSNTTGGYNTFIGRLSGAANTDGTDNTFLGLQAGYSNSTGDYNTFAGNYAGQANTIGTNNSAFGNVALYTNIDGIYNSAFGNGALYTNTGDYNNAFGAFALYGNVGGFANNAFGESALYTNTEGRYNNAFGGAALFSNTTGWYNNAFGDEALESNTIGDNNSAFGEDVLNSNTEGDNNSAFGTSALFSNVIGNGNSAFGSDVLYYNTGSYNSAFGTDALLLNTIGENNSAFGMNTLSSNTTGGFNSALGLSSLDSNVTGEFNSAFGTWSLSTNTVGGLNTGIGLFADVGSGNLINATALGAFALVNQNDSLVLGSINGVNNATGSARIGIGTISPTATLDLQGGDWGGRAAFIVNQTGNSANDIFTASSSGVTKFALQNDGKILAPFYSTCTLKTDSTGLVTCGTDNTGGGASEELIDQASGLTYVGNTTSAFAIGGNSTASAKFVFSGTNNGSLAIATFSGALMMEAQANSSRFDETNWQRISQSAAGTIAEDGGSTTGIASISAMTVYNGNLYVGTYDDSDPVGAAEVYRYDGGTAWTKVSHGTAGTISGTNGATGIASVSAMTVWDGYMYIGTSKVNGAEVYRYEGNSVWKRVSQTTPGTIDGGGTASIDGVISMGVYQGRLHIGTREPGGAQLYKYEGGSDWTVLNTTAGTFVATNTAGVHEVSNIVVKNGFLYFSATKYSDADFMRYSGGVGATSAFFLSMNTVGTAATGGRYVINGATLSNFDEVTATAVYNGNVVVALRRGNNQADIVVLNDGMPVGATAPNSWTRLNHAPGQMVFGGTSGIDSISSLTVHNGILYAGTNENGNAEIYRYTGGDEKWSEVSQANGTLSPAGGSTTLINSVSKMISLNGDLYAGTMENDSAEVYKLSNVNLNKSYSIMFHAAPNVAEGEQGAGDNMASIFFLASASANLGSNFGNSGAFIFSHGIQTRNGSYDVAEDYPTRDDEIEPGDLVAIDKDERGFVKKTTEAYDYSVLGVFSEKPALRLTQEDVAINGGRSIPVALAGRVPVKVSTENGEIQPGDYLTASSIPGVAMKATKTGVTFGQALEGYVGEEIGKVMTYIKSMTYNGSIADSYVQFDANSPEFAVNVLDSLNAQETNGKSSVITDRLIAGLEVITPKISARKVNLDEIHSLTNSDISLNLSSDGKFIIKNSSGSGAITFDSNGNATFAGLIIADRIKANQIEGLEIFTNKLSALDRNLASLSGSLNSEVLGSSTQSGELSSELTLSSLNVDGLVTISSDLNVKGNGFVEGMLNVLDSISTPNLLVSDFASFFGDVFFKKDVRFEGVPTFNKDTAGFAVINKGDSSVTVKFDEEYNETPIVTTSIAFDKIDDPIIQKKLEDAVLTGNISYIITNRTTEGFTIKLSKEAEEDISFSWVALSVKDAKVTKSENVIPTQNPQATQSAAYQSILDQLNNSPTPPPN